MLIYEEKAGIVSKGTCWVCICDPYMYIADTLLELIDVLNREWENDKHLVGYGDDFVFARGIEENK